MGCADSTTTTSTKIAPLSPEGMTYDQAFQEMMVQQLQSSGYAINPTQKTVYQDPEKYSSMNTKLDGINSQIASVQAQIDKRNATQSAYSGGAGFSAHSYDPLQAQLDSLNKQRTDLSSGIASLPQTTYTDYQIQKAPDPRVQQLYDQYGYNPNWSDAQKQQFNNSQAGQEMNGKVTTINQQITAESASKAQTMADVEASYLKNLKKFVSGDMSYTQDQKDQVDKYFAPIRDTITGMADTLLSKIGTDNTKLGGYLNDLSSQIDKTGFKVQDALKAAGIQLDKNGGDLLDTVKAVNDSTAAKFKFQQDLIFQDIDTKAAQQAAFLGLPPGSMAEQLQKVKQKQNVLQALTLQMNEQEMQSNLGVHQYVAQGKDKLAISAVALAESQGEKQEGVSQARFNLAKDTAGKEEDVINAKGNAMLALSQSEQNQLLNAAFGGIPSMLQAGAGGMAFQTNQSAANTNNFNASIAPLIQQLGVQQQDQLAQATTTQKTQGSFLSSLGQLFGMGESAAATGMGIAMPAPQMPSSGGGGGGVASQPIQFNLGGPSSFPTATGFNLGGGYGAGYAG